MSLIKNGRRPTAATLLAVVFTFLLVFLDRLIVREVNPVSGTCAFIDSAAIEYKPRSQSNQGSEKLKPSLMQEKS
jgi:hypothetical protein